MKRDGETGSESNATTTTKNSHSIHVECCYFPLQTLCRHLLTFVRTNTVRRTHALKILCTKSKLVWNSPEVISDVWHSARASSALWWLFENKWENLLQNTSTLHRLHSDQTQCTYRCSVARGNSVDFSFGTTFSLLRSEYVFRRSWEMLFARGITKFALHSTTVIHSQPVFSNEIFIFSVRYRTSEKIWWKSRCNFHMRQYFFRRVLKIRNNI